MKKLVLTSAAMGGAALIVFGASGTFAAFSDTAAADAGAGAGTLTVAVDESAAATVDTGSLAPGETVVIPFRVLNESESITGLLGGSVTDVVNLENGCNDPEQAAGDPTCGDATTAGEFGGVAQISYGAITLREGQECNADTAVPTGAGNNASLGVLNDANPARPSRVLAPGQAACVLVQVTLPESAGNIVQGDSAQFTLNFDLEQRV